MRKIGFSNKRGVLSERLRMVQIAALVVAGFCVTGLSEESWLTWKNGDSLKGEMVASEGAKQVLRWKSELFEEPFDIKLDQLEMVQFGAEKKLENEEEPFRITLKSGDVLAGELVSISGSDVKFKSSRMGDGSPISLNRDDVAIIERVVGTGILVTGPHGQRGWKSVGRERKIADWEATPDGRLGTNRWHGDLFYPKKFPNKFQAKFTLRSKLNPLEFTAGFYLDPAQGPTVETWDDTVVLTFGNEFVPLMDLSSETKMVTLQVFWDRDKGVVSVHNADGKMLGKLEDVKGILAQSKQDQNRRRSVSNRNGNAKEEGFSLLNKSTDLFFGDFRVRSWDGDYPPEIESDKKRVELSDGSAIYNAVTSLSSSGVKFAGGKSKELMLVDKFIFDLETWDLESKENPDKPNVYVAWMDGTVLAGQLKGIDGDSISILPAWSEDPVKAKLGSTRKIAFLGNDAEDEPKAADPGDVLYVKNQALKGTLVTDDNKKEPKLLWRPPGAVNASPMAAGLSPRVVRGNGEPTEIGFIGSGYVYLTNDEVLSGKLLSIGADKIHFQSEYTGQIALDPAVVRAIDITAFSGKLDGFDDAGWQKFPDETLGENSVKLEKEKAVLKKGSFGHPSVLGGDVVTFDLQWKQPYVGSITMKLFSGDLKGGGPSKDVVLMGQGQQMYVGEFRDGQFNYSGQRVEMKDGKASITIQHKKNKLTVKVNKTEALSTTLDEKTRAGNGLVFQEGGWQGFAGNETQVTVSNLKVMRTPGFLPVRYIDPEAAKEARQVPRFSRDNPPTHVLVAPNGDLLRGRLIAASGDSVRFQSKLDTFNFPRERVSSIIFLKPAPEKGEEDEPKKTAKAEKPSFVPTHRFIMNDGSRFALKAKAVVDGKMLGESELLGSCEVPTDRRQAHEIRLGPAITKDAKDSIVVAYAGWVVEHAPEPVIPTDDGGESSPLVGEAAKNFKLAMLDGGEFNLSDHKGKRVVVLDFWATWCGPCIRAMPEIFRGTAPFGEDIAFLAVNQGETPPIIQQFLKQRGWDGVPVGLDTKLAIGDQFEVQGIPHTVVIDKDGKVAWVHSGFKEGMGEDLANAISNALK